MRVHPARGRPAATACLAVAMATSPALAQQAPPPIEMPISAAGEGISQTTAGPVRGIQALTADSATRTQTPLQQLPQSVQVVTRALIDQQRPISQSEAMQNVSGLQPLSTMMFGQLGPKLRGFQADRFVDGMPNYYDAGARDLLVNVERIEVLKGPASLFHFGGTGQIGGVINVISKMPTAQRFAEVGVTYGGYNLVSPYFDVNQPLNQAGTVLFRMTGQYQSTGASTHGFRQGGFSLNPTLVLTNNDTTTVTLQANLSHQTQLDYPGLPAVGTLDTSGFAVNRRLFAAVAGLPSTRSTNYGFTAKLDHAFGEVWSNMTTLRMSKSHFNEPTQLIIGNRPFFPPSTFGVFNGLLKENTSEIGFNSSMIARFNAGPTENRVVLGVDHNTVWDRGFLDGSLDGLVDFAAPVFPTYVTPTPGPFTTFTSIRNRYTQSGASAQVQSKAWGRLHLLAGARVANVNLRSNELTTGGAFTTDQTKVLPRVGLGFDLVPGFMVYAAYNEGLKAVPYFNGPTAPKAQGSEQAEAGVKFDTAWGLSGTIAAYQLTLSNVPVANLAVPGTQVQTGQQQSRGIEADLIWQPMRGLSFLASYAHTLATVTRDTTLPRGTALSQVPRNSGRLWANYRFGEGRLEGLSIGGGLYGASEQAVTVGGPWRTPGYVTLDAAASYPIGGVTVAVVAKNLANQRYWVPYSFLDGRVAPGAGRTVFATVSARF